MVMVKMLQTKKKQRQNFNEADAPFKRITQAEADVSHPLSGEDTGSVCHEGRPMEVASHCGEVQDSSDKGPQLTMSEVADSVRYLIVRLTTIPLSRRWMVCRGGFPVELT